MLCWGCVGGIAYKISMLGASCGGGGGVCQSLSLNYFSIIFFKGGGFKSKCYGGEVMCREAFSL